MWDSYGMIMDLLIFILALGISVRTYIHGHYIKKIHEYLYENQIQEQQEMQEFMEGFAEAMQVFIEEEQLESNSKKIKEWDES